MNTNTVKIYILEGLRGYLSLWVFGGHLLRYSGLSPQTGILGAISDSSHAVMGFMILSGFVIAMLMDRRQESYRIYLTRRWLRLFPALAAAVLTGYFLHPLWGKLITGWYPGFFDSGILGDFRQSWGATESNPTGYLLAVLSMVNGLIPDPWMPMVSIAFIGVVWSLSLEIQFYVVAPALDLIFRKRWSNQVFPIILLIGYFAIRQPLLGCLGMPTWKSFLPASVEYFLIGMISYKAFNHMRNSMKKGVVYSARLSLLWLLLVVLILGSGDGFRKFVHGELFTLTGNWTAILIWCVCLFWLIDRLAGHHGLLHRSVEFILAGSFARFLGKISYSIYLWHVPLIIAAQSALRVMKPEITAWECLLYTSLVTIPATLLVSWLSFRFIESPFIALGNRIFHKKEATP